MVKVGDRIVGAGHEPFIIAEMSANHNHSLERALAIVDAVAEAGAHAVKLQTYTPETMTVPGAYQIEDANSLWDGKELFDLYKEAYMPWEWHQPIFDHAKKKGLIAFSSPFDEKAVDFLETLHAPCYKIASFENTDWPLLKKVATKGKPIIMSTGVSSLKDIVESVNLLREQGVQDLVLLKCTSTYPAAAADSNILTIPHMTTLFECPVGLSDHTLGIGVAVASIALGACVIEKHVTLNRADGGVDAAFSLEPAELKALVLETKQAAFALGKVTYEPSKAEGKSKFFKRSIYVVKDIHKGERFTKENLRVIRPGLGLAPKYMEEILSLRARTDLPAGTPLSWNGVGAF